MIPTFQDDGRAGALGQLHEKLAAVTTATERAATGMLDGLDRAIAVVAELELEAGENGDLERRARYTALREELYGVISFLQFQDVTSQQLQYAASVLREPAPGGAPATARPFDPDAVRCKADVQAFADSIFRAR